MKKPFFIACTLLVAASVFAQGSYVRAKQQAMHDTQLNNAEQQRIANEANGGAAQANAAAPAPARPMDPVLQATLANIANLQTNFTAAVNAPDGKPDDSQKVSLLNNLTQAAQGTKKASEDSVKRLADDLVAAVGGNKKLTTSQRTSLARYVHAVFNGSHLSDMQQQTVLTAVQKILTDSGVSLDNAVNVVTDLKGIVAETK